jgi:hypothetical protein
MRQIQQHSVAVTNQARRDGVASLEESTGEPPAIVSISDIHGYLNSAHSALLTLRDHSEHDPVVVPDTDGQLQWANENYVLLFNGDLTDRGDKNEAVLRMVSRLAAQAPPGRVRVTLGNHEAIALSADHFPYSQWYAGRSDGEDRRALINAIHDGLVVAAYQGYNYTYAHAGASKPYNTGTVNQRLVEAAHDLLNALGTQNDTAIQQAVIDQYSRVLGTGDRRGPKSKGAGLVWLNLKHLPHNAPAQIVGHTKFETPQRQDNVVCQNVIIKNRHSKGGEAVFIETPDELVSLTRTQDGGTRQQDY